MGQNFSTLIRVLLKRIKKLFLRNLEIVIND